MLPDAWQKARMRITVKFYATEQEVYDWVKFYNVRAYSKLETYGVLGFALMIGFANLLFPGASRVVGVAGLVLALLVIFSPQLLARASARRVDPHRVWQYEIDDKKLAAYSGSDEVVVEWNAFRQWAESPEAFYIIARRHRYLIVPKRGFEEPAHAEEFGAFLSTRFKKIA